jgi:nitroreductase
MTVLEAIRRRRTCRNFTDEPVPSHIIREIVEAGREAPVSRVSGTPIHISVIRNRGVLDMIEGSMKDGGTADRILSAENMDTSRLVNSVVNTKRSKNNVGKGYLYGASTLIVVSHRIYGDSESSLLVAGQDAACIIENMLIAATWFGLGSAYLYSIIGELNDSEELRKILKIPASFRPIGSCAIGYDSGEYFMPKVKRGKVSYI